MGPPRGPNVGTRPRWGRGTHEDLPLRGVGPVPRLSRSHWPATCAAPWGEVVVQEDFQQHGRTLLEKLETYIAGCDRVIVLVGDAYGAEPPEAAPPVGSAAAVLHPVRV